MSFRVRLVKPVTQEDQDVEVYLEPLVLMVVQVYLVYLELMVRMVKLDDQESQDLWDPLVGVLCRISWFILKFLLQVNFLSIFIKFPKLAEHVLK